MGKYDDIIGRKHPTSKVHPRMSLQARAAQFSPFAALTGFEEAVREAERTTEERIELDEYERAELDYRLHRLQPVGDDEIVDPPAGVLLPRVEAVAPPGVRAGQLRVAPAEHVGKPGGE